MGFFGSLIGWDQSNGAVNAVLASYLIEKADRADRILIAKEVVNIIAGVQRGSLDLILQDISKQSRVVQMNFIALACDNLHIDPPVQNNVWSRVENPYRVGNDIDENRISAAIHAIEKQDGVRVSWPGNAARIDFTKMYEEGFLLSIGKDSPNTNVRVPQETKLDSLHAEHKNPLLEAYRQYLLTAAAKQLPPTPFKKWAIQRENTILLNSLATKYFGEKNSCSEVCEEARKLPPDQLIGDEDYEDFGADLIEFCLGVARYEIARFQHGSSWTEKKEYFLLEDVEDWGEEYLELMLRVTRSVLLGKSGLFVSSEDEEDFGCDVVVLMYRIALFSVFASEEESKEQEPMTLLRALIGHQASMRANAVDSDVLPSAYGPFGLSVTNPVLTHSAQGSKDYITKLKTLEGRPVVARRIGSTSAPANVTTAMIDVYSLSVDGEGVATVYICPYHKANSSKAPEGFTLSR